MATVSDSKTYSSGNAVSHSINLTDLTFSAGDLLYIAFGTDSNAAPLVNADGFQGIAYDARGSIEYRHYWYAKKAEGTETSFDITWASGSYKMRAVVLVITSWTGQLESIWQTWGSTTNLAAQTLPWTDSGLAIHDVYMNPTTDGGNPAVTGYPSNFPNNQVTTSGADDAQGLATATFASVSSVDPAAWSVVNGGTASLGLTFLRDTTLSLSPTPVRTGQYTVGGLGVVTATLAGWGAAPGEAGPAAGEYALLWIALRDTRITWTMDPGSGWTYVAHAYNSGGSGMSAALYERWLDGTSSDDISLDNGSKQYSVCLVSYRNTTGRVAYEVRYVGTFNKHAALSALDVSTPGLGVLFGGHAGAAGAMGAGPRGGRELVLSQPYANASAGAVETLISNDIAVSNLGVAFPNQSSMLAGGVVLGDVSGTLAPGVFETT